MAADVLLHRKLTAETTRQTGCMSLSAQTHVKADRLKTTLSLSYCTETADSKSNGNLWILRWLANVALIHPSCDRVNALASRFHLVFSACVTRANQ